ncbi:MAG: hypothetical protein EBX35_10045, partial [Planctomycetia bacterium]|nr:hypothetical protein [Planctomycetia bacterium]
MNYTGSGTINLAGALTIASNAGTGNASYTQTSGLLNTASILLGDSVTNTTGSRTFNLSGGRVNVGSGGMASTGTTTATRAVNLGAGTLGARADWSSSLAMSLTSASTGTTINTLDSVDGTTGRTITLSGVLSGSGLLTKAGGGTLVLSGTNTYSGGTTVSAGTLQAGAVAGGQAFGNLSAVTLANAAGAVLDLNNFAQTIGSLAGGGAAGGSVSLGSGTLTTGGSNASTQFSGVIAGTGGMTKTGTGTLSLAGANTYTGTTTISAGTLALAGPETPGTSGPLGTQPANAPGTVLMTGGTLQFSVVNTNDYSGRFGTAGGQAWNIDTNSQSVTFSGALQGATSALAKYGVGTLTLSGANTYGGTTAINQGTLEFAVTTGGTVTLSGVVSGTGRLTKTGGGSLILSNANTFSGTTTVGAGVLGLNANLSLQNSVLETAGAGTIALGSGVTNPTIGGLSGATGDLATLISSGYPLVTALTLNPASGSSSTYGGVIANGAAGMTLTKTGVGTQVLAGANTYTGTTTINQGTLKLTGTAVLGGAAGSTADANNIVFGQSLDSGVLEFDSVANLGPADQIRFRNTGGTAGLGGALVYVGGSAETLSKTIQCDTSIGIRIESNSTGGSLTVNGPFIQTNRGIYLGGSGTGNNTLASVFTGTGGLTKRGVGTWILSGVNTYSGNTTIEQGSLAFAADQSVTGGLVFGAANGATNNGGLDLGVGSATFASLLVRTNSATANTVTIGSGKTLTVTGAFTLGYDAAGGTGATRSNLTVSGAGAMSLTGTTVTIGTNQAATNAAYWNDATLDVTGLSNFTTNVTTFNVGVGTTTQGPGTLLLSNTANTLVATTLTAGDTVGNNGRGTGRIQLGAGTNIIQVDTLNIGRSKNSGPGVVEFLAKNAGSPGTVTITNKAGTGAANITVGDNNGTATAGGATGTLDLRGHVANVTAGTLLAGRNNMGSTGTGSVTSDVFFDAGTFTVNTITMAQKSAAGTGG